MEFYKKNPSRKFRVGKNNDIEILDCGKLFLESNEQISFITSSHKEYDFVAKTWGFYATPSVNGRLVNEGFKSGLVKNKYNKYYIMVVENEKLEEFFNYLNSEDCKLVEWLDEREN